MFLSPNVPALFKKGTLKLQTSDEGLRRVAEATLVIEPFPASLARELGDEIAGHLFDDVGSIRPELEGIDLRVRVGLQSVIARHDEALEPIALLVPVSIKDVSVQRIEDTKTQRTWLACSFVLVFSLEERAARNFVLDEFGKTLLWSFTAMQRELLNQAAIHDAIGKMVPSGGGIDSVTFKTPGHEPVTLTREDAKVHRDTAKKLRQAADESTKH